MFCIYFKVFVLKFAALKANWTFRKKSKVQEEKGRRVSKTALYNL